MGRVALRVVTHPMSGILEDLKHYFKYATTYSFDIIRNDAAALIKKFNSYLRLKMACDCEGTEPTPEESDRVTAQVVLGALCLALGIPSNRAEHAYLALFGDILPHKAPAIWSKKTAADAQLDPLEFYQKYWGRYVESELLYQVDLRALDPSLFEAIKIHVRRHLKGRDPRDYLPPPNQSRLGRRVDQPELSILATIDTVELETTPQRSSTSRGVSRPLNTLPRL
jgi:hypothetical protein